MVGISLFGKEVISVPFYLYWGQFNQHLDFKFTTVELY